MTVTYTHLVGDYENLDKTIAFRLSDDWTEMIVPTFENGTDEPDYQAQFDRSGPNTILVNTTENDFTDNTDEVNSDTVHSAIENVVITIIAESRTVRVLFENEINRILWELSPNSTVRLLKTDDTDSTHVDHFVKSEVSFTQIDITDDFTAYLQGSEGILQCVYYKIRT